MTQPPSSRVKLRTLVDGGEAARSEHPDIPALKLNALPSLKCPDCSAPLDVPTRQLDNGCYAWQDYCVVECCKAWSVVAGIPVFQHRPRLARLIRAGQYEAALLLALRPEDFKNRPSEFFAKLYGEVRGLRWKKRHSQLIAKNATFREWLEAGFPASVQNVRDYYFYKFTTPKHFAALAVATTLPSGTCLDIGCGTGQITRSLSRLGPATGVDRSFWLLYLAKTFIAPEANFVCCDAEQSLPFMEGTFASVMSSNAFHFIRNQSQLLRECRRVSDGPIALTSLRHVLGANAVENYARDFAGYTALAAKCGMQSIIADEADVVARYLKGLGPDFDQPVPPEESTQLITVLLDGAATTHGPLEGWLHTGTSINPLYQPDAAQGDFRLQWPSDTFRADNPGFDYLPERVHPEMDGHLVHIDLPKRYG